MFFLIAKGLGLGCPILALTGFPCPTCGMTRAMRCLLRLDFAGYHHWQPMALPVFIAVWLLIHQGRIRSKQLRRAVSVISTAILIGNLALYLSALME